MCHVLWEYMQCIVGIYAMSYGNKCKVLWEYLQSIVGMECVQGIVEMECVQHIMGICAKYCGSLQNAVGMCLKCYENVHNILRE